jgi:phosphatidylinositol alpha-1,6-mannosyltransferase
VRVLLATPDFPPAIGGIQAVAYSLAKSFTRVRAQTITPAQEGNETVDAGLDVVRTHPGSPHLAAMAALNAGALRHALKDRPDGVLSLHIVCAPASVAACKRGIPYVQYLHADEVAARPRLARWAVRHAARTIVVSSHTRDLARKLGASDDTIDVIPPGIDGVAEIDEPKSTRPTILTVARLVDRYKGHDVMLEAMARVRAAVPSARWVVVGDGPLRPELEARARSLGVDDLVSFVGFVPPEERDLWYARSHVFAMPSRLEPGSAGEGFGIAYMEASAHGLPVVAGDAAGALDAVQDGTTGLLVRPDDPAAVASALIRLIEDRELASALGERGSRRSNDFLWPSIARRVEDALAAAYQTS